MQATPEELRHISLFGLLDEAELAVLAAQVDTRHFAPRQRIYKQGDVDGKAFLLMSGAVEVSTIDEDQQPVVVEQPAHGEPFGLASMLEGTAHRTSAVATEATVCLEIDREDMAEFLRRKPLAGMEMLTVLARQIHKSQELVRVRAARNPNVVIEEKETTGERIADRVASFGGSWTFIILFAVVLVTYTSVNVLLKGRAWDPYPFILLNLFLSMLAAIQAPVIMMSQNRQDKKDRLRSELDFDVNVRAESEIQTLSRQMKAVQEKLEDVEGLLSRESTAPPAQG